METLLGVDDEWGVRHPDYSRQHTQATVNQVHHLIPVGFVHFFSCFKPWPRDSYIPSRMQTTIQIFVSVCCPIRRIAGVLGGSNPDRSASKLCRATTRIRHTSTRRNHATIKHDHAQSASRKVKLKRASFGASLPRAMDIWISYKHRFCCTMRGYPAAGLSKAAGGCNGLDSPTATLLIRPHALDTAFRRPTVPSTGTKLHSLLPLSTVPQLFKACVQSLDQMFTLLIRFFYIALLLRSVHASRPTRIICWLTTLH